ncbi:thiamine phosphate synthase [Azospirillum thermophilum]|uniref:Thiamine phosphate synthase n=1 Tax=Azospirillum thermophilum TaxID=2202148 RepID=A0A2S2CLD9_9PROT|nr:thiamine phosphate synthase [Azospirillum thermophilum]AWK85276.1 thiamine phosphate synthase [Azospirillum thermophilum]
MTVLPDPPLLAITDRRQAALPLPDLAERLFASGLRWLSLREKDLPADQLLALAGAVLQRARRHGARLTLHGEARLALAAGADGVHLPDGGDAVAARRLLGPRALIGVSCHDRERLLRAAGEGADYATLSPVFATASKPGYGPALGPDLLRRMVAGVPIPVLALGGVEAGNLAGCLEAGAAGAAVMGTLMRDPDGLPALLREVGQRA